MKIFLLSIAATALLTHGISMHGADRKDSISPLEELTEESSEIKGTTLETLDGFALKVAKPFMKKTPMAAIMNELDRMVMFAMEDTSSQEDSLFAGKASEVLKNYLKVTEIRENNSVTTLYTDTPDGEAISEIVMYITEPGIAMMIFRGEFTQDSLKRMGELSQQQKKQASEENGSGK